MTGDELFYWVMFLGYIVLIPMAIKAEISFNKAKEKQRKSGL